MKSLYLVGSVGLAALFLAYGCAVTVKESTPGVGTGGAGGKKTVSVTAPSSTTTGTGGTTSGTGGMAPADESTSCADAVALAQQMNNQGVTLFAAQGILNPAGDKDYFRFTAKKGDWINLHTEANTMDDPMMVDTVITLFTQDGKTQLAEVDDAWPRGNTPDSDMDFHVPLDGTYCLQVQEFSSWKKGATPKGDPSFQYVAVMVPYSADNLKVIQGLDLDAGSNDTLQTPQTLKNVFVNSMSAQIFDRVYGLLDPKTDKDVYKITTPAKAAVFQLDFPPAGPKGNGSTDGIGLVNLWSGNGQTLIAQLNYDDATKLFKPSGRYGMSGVPVAEKTDYLLEINRGAADVGTNDFYFYAASTGDNTALNPQEANDANNKTSAGAETMTAQQNMKNPKFTNRFIGGTIPAGDVDYWKFNANQGENIIVVCSSQRAGSGVGDFTVELYQDPAKAALQAETEVATADILWDDPTTSEDASKPSVKAPTTGTYYIKLSATKMLTSGATSNFYLCGVHTQAP